MKQGYDLLGKPIPEKEIQDQIRQILSYSCVVFRANVGTFRQGNRFINTGLPNGFPDLFGFRKSDGKLFFIEVKNAKGRLSKAQKDFAAEVQNYDVLYGVARSVKDALEIINGDKTGEKPPDKNT